MDKESETYWGGRVFYLFGDRGKEGLVGGDCPVPPFEPSQVLSIYSSGSSHERVVSEFPACG